MEVPNSAGKNISCQALNCFLLLVQRAALPFAILQFAILPFSVPPKRIDVSDRRSPCSRMMIWVTSILDLNFSLLLGGGRLLPPPSTASHLPLHPPRQVQGLPELICIQSHPCNMVKQVNKGGRKALESAEVNHQFRYLVLYQIWSVLLLSLTTVTFFRVLKTRCLPLIELRTSVDTTPSVQMPQL